MQEQAFTLAVYRVKPGREEEFIRVWNGLADTFSSLPDPPLWGTLIRHATERTLFYSFGPWESAEHVQSMRESPEADRAFAALHELCEELTAGDYEIVRHVDVRSRTGAGSASD